jgi:transcriptional regulator with XRE-family HTH domain
MAFKSKVTIPPNAHPLVRLLFAGMIEQNITYVQMAERSGISRETLTAWRVRYTPDLISLEAVLGVLGLRFEALDHNGQTYKPRPETLARLGQTHQERMQHLAICCARAAARVQGSTRRPRGSSTQFEAAGIQPPS